jgi:hypothetical protein
MNDSPQGFGLNIAFIGHFNIQLVITFNYSAIGHFHTLQITRGLAKSFPDRSVFISSWLVTDPTVTIPLLPCWSPFWMAAPTQLTQLESELLDDWRFTANQFVLVQSPLLLTTSIVCNRTLAVKSLCNIFSDERMGLSFTIAAGLR